MTIQEKAEVFESQFVLKNRDNGNAFYCLIDNADEDLRDLIHSAHDDLMPDDYKYQFIYDAISGISKDRHYSEVISADVYTSALTAWLNSSNGRVYYLTEALESFQPSDGFNALTIAQEIEKEEVYRSVLSSLEQLV